MGGNALSVKTRRYDHDEYMDILFDVQSKLTDHGIVSEIPKWFRNKDTFGDLDVLIKSSTVKGDIHSIIDEFKPNQVYNNSHVKSFDYREFQIDFILVTDENWESSINYFSYNDLGNLIGRISYNMGFRFGDYGLKLVYRHEDGGKKFTKIVSTDAKKIYEFLGFDYDRYLEGFDDLTDVFDFVVQSKYFNPKIFDYDNLNHQNRTRNKKRVNYEAFLEYIKYDKDDVLKEKKWTRNSEIDRAEEFFDIQLFTLIRKWEKSVDSEKEASAKFNGNIIMEHYPELKGKALGTSITNLKNTLYDEYSFLEVSDVEKKTFYSNWILSHDLDEIFELFKIANNLN